MPKKEVAFEHPMSAANKKMSRTKQVLEGTQDIFNKLDQGTAKEESVAPEVKDLKSIKNLKELLFFGNLAKDIEIDGYYFRIRTLTHKEHRDISKRIMKLSNEDRVIESNILFLAASLERINGLPIEDAYQEIFDAKEIPNLEPMDLCLEILSNLHAHLVGKLIDEYFALSEQSKKYLQQERAGEEENLKKIAAEPESRLRWKLCKALKIKVDDDFFKDINAIQWLWYAYQVSIDDKESFEDKRDFTEYLASFWNSEAVAKVKESRSQRDVHKFANNQEFEDQIKEKSFKDNKYINAIKEIRKQRENGNIDKSNEDLDSRLPKDLKFLKDY